MRSTTHPSRLLASLLALSIGLALAVAARPSLAAAPFSNNAGITFLNPSATPPLTPELAAPYPSVISVANLKGSITKVTATVSGLSHSFPDSVELLLVGPAGQQVLLMSDVGANNPVSGLTLTFADSATASLPDSGALTGGTFKPTKGFGTVAFPAPAPAPTGNTSLSVFNLTDPNGDWRLFAVEDTSGTLGSISGWSLSIETADLAAEVSAAPATVNAGSPLAYSVTLHNFGTEAVAGATATIDIPAGTSFSAAIAPAGWACPAPAAGATALVCTAASFASGATATVDVTLLVDKALAPDTPLARAAAISSAVPEADTANNSAAATTGVTTLADLSVSSVDSPANVSAGAEMTVAIAVQNAGPSNAAGASLTIPVPASTTFVSIAAADGWSCAGPAVGAAGDAVCTSAVFTTASASFSLVVKVDPALAGGTTLTSDASITSGTADSTPGNNTGRDTTLVGTATDLGVTVESAPDPVSAAANLVYTIVVTNNGPSNAAGAALATEVRSGTTFVGLEAPAGWSCTSPAVASIGAVSCTNPSFGVTTATFKLTVQVLSGTPVGTVLQHSSAVSSTTSDSAAGNNTANETTTVTVAADLSVTMEGVGATVRRGTNPAYTLKVNNSGPELAESVTLTTAVPANTTFVSLTAPAGWACAAPVVGATGAITCTNPVLDVTTDQIVLTVKLGDVATGTEVPFSASVQSPTEDGNPANNSVSQLARAVPPFSLFLPLVRK